MTMPEWVRLVFWTMLGGSLAAGSANAINQYLDRDIDLLMSAPVAARCPPRRRARARDGVRDRLGVISIAIMAWSVNLVAAFLTLLAIAFYVVVYTIILKRTTRPEHRHRRGRRAHCRRSSVGRRSPGASRSRRSSCSPSSSTGRRRTSGRSPCASARTTRRRRVPMLPVVKGVPETAGQIALYTVLLVAISLVLYSVAGMGWVYLWRGRGLGRDVPVAGVRAAAAGRVARGLAGAGDLAVPVLDQLSHPAVRRGRRGTALVGSPFWASPRAQAGTGPPTGNAGAGSPGVAAWFSFRRGRGPWPASGGRHRGPA